MTCGFLIQLVFFKKNKNYVVYWCWSRARDECTPSWKKSWIRPCWCVSSRGEVFMRILALLQRKTLIKTKNRSLKCLKHYSTVRSMKKFAVLTEDGAFALLFRPHPGELDSSRVPTLGNLPSKAKKMLMPGGQPGGGAGGGLGAAGIDWCIKLKGLCFNVASRCLLFSKTNLRQENRLKLSLTEPEL